MIHAQNCKNKSYTYDKLAFFVSTLMKKYRNIFMGAADYLRAWKEFWLPVKIIIGFLLLVSSTELDTP